MSSFKDSLILVVEDEPGMRRGLRRVLMPPYLVRETASIEEALAAVNESQFDLALVDVRLPDGDGYQLMQAMKQKQPDLDVILMTGSTSEPDEKLYRSLVEGAYYFFFKPIDRQVLLALVDRCLRLRRAQQENIGHIKRLSADLAQAALFQKSLLPEGPLINAHWHIEGRLRSCDAVSGDTFAYFPLKEGVAVALGDVSGHGVRSAMFTGMLIFALRSALRVDPCPRELLRLLRQETDFFEPPNFATMVYGWLTDDGACNYFNAGHPDIFWQHEDEVRLLPSTAPLLMNTPFSVPDEIASISLAPGDRLVICSDGLLEARYEKGAQFGKERMQGAIRSASLLPIPEAIGAVLACMDEHCRHRPQVDDITLLIIERR